MRFAEQRLAVQALFKKVLISGLPGTISGL
jgi:hypothetical protein